RGRGGGRLALGRGPGRLLERLQLAPAQRGAVGVGPHAGGEHRARHAVGRLLRAEGVDEAVTAPGPAAATAVAHADLVWVLDAAVHDSKSPPGHARSPGGIGIGETPLERSPSPPRPRRAGRTAVIWTSPPIAARGRGRPGHRWVGRLGAWETAGRCPVPCSPTSWPPATPAPRWSRCGPRHTRR